MQWYENDGTPEAGLWTGHLVDGAANGADDVVAADLDGDGDVDLAAAIRDGLEFSWYENRGGQFGLPTTDSAFAGIAEGEADDVLGIDATHRGRNGDTGLELATVELRFEDEFGTPLTTPQASALIQTLARQH